MYLPMYPFVRLCQMSPKDVARALSPEEALATSQRTGPLLYTNPCHLIMREEKKYLEEVRCFWSRDRLRCVSGSVEVSEEEIKAFFYKYGFYIPYHSAVVDLGRTIEGWELIEFNSFGPDLNATVGNFSWREDIEILLNAEEVVFR